MSQVSICIYFVFDIADEIDLVKAQKSVIDLNPGQFRLRKYNREMVLEDAPLILGLEEIEYIYNSKAFKANVTGKLWNYGALSVMVKFNVGENVDFSSLIPMVEALEEDDQIYQMIYERIQGLVEGIRPALNKANIWKGYEDYTIIQFEGQKGESVTSHLGKENLMKLIEGESDIKLSQQTKDSYQQWIFQYTDDDFLMMDWNRAVLAGEKQDVEEKAEILEFALCQLLELRFYDDLLDKSLSSLYKSIQKSKKSIWSNNYAQLSKEASLRYIEFSEVIDMVGNSLKVIGDSYYARIYRVALERFRVSDWKKTVSDKLDNLASISTLFSAEVNEQRNQLLEIIIIILIAIEVIPYLYQLFQG